MNPDVQLCSFLGASLGAKQFCTELVTQADKSATHAGESAMMSTPIADASVMRRSVGPAGQLKEMNKGGKDCFSVHCEVYLSESCSRLGLGTSLFSFGCVPREQTLCAKLNYHFPRS